MIVTRNKFSTKGSSGSNSAIINILFKTAWFSADDLCGVLSLNGQLKFYFQVHLSRQLDDVRNANHLKKETKQQNKTRIRLVGWFSFAS